MLRHLWMLAVAAGLGSGIVAGLLFAFSTSVMRALSQLPAEHGMRAMQHINVVIINPLFLAVFLGTGLLCVLLAAGALQLTGAARWLLAGGSFAYLAGTLGVTFAVNVPMNNRLARSAAADASAVWPGYVERWLRWNHVRAAAAVAASVMLVLAAVRLRGPGVD
jgi:uncharacterized membrane protein